MKTISVHLNLWAHGVPDTNILTIHKITVWITERFYGGDKDQNHPSLHRQHI